MVLLKGVSLSGKAQISAVICESVDPPHIVINGTVEFLSPFWECCAIE